MKKYKLYVFDFDGTLFDTLECMKDIFIAAYGAIGIKVKAEDCQQYAREPLEPRFVSLGGKLEDIPTFSRVITEVQDDPKTMAKTQLFPDTKFLLDRLNELGVKTAIVTSNDSSHVKSILNMFNVSDNLFPIIIGHFECKASKPAPDSLLMAIEKSGFSNDLNDVVYIGDALNDTLAAKNAGVDGVLIDRIDEFKDSEDFTRIHSMEELFR